MRISRNRVRGSSRLEKVNARYDAAGHGRRMAGWTTPTSGPNTAISGLQKIRDRSRDVIRNEWSGASNVRVWTTNIVGTGIIPRPNTKNLKLKARFQELWKSWVPLADADGVLDFYGLLALVVRCFFSDGEVFVRIRPRRLTDGIPVPMQLQILEADMVPLLDADAYAGLPEGNVIRQGIEIDRIGRRAAYWMWRNHPGDKPISSINPNDVYRVPAESVLHVFEPLRPGQLRGVPEMAAVITKLRNVADFDDAVLERQKLANLFTMFITRQVPSGANDPMTGLPIEGSFDQPLAGLEPGIAQELGPGEDVKFSSPPDAGGVYTDFMRTQNLGVAAGSGTPYELMSGDIKDVSDRTLRILINEFRRLCEQKQWLVFIPQMCQKVLDSWVGFASLAGEISTDEAGELKDVRWSPQGWAYIHPVQDVQARIAEYQSGFRSRASIVAERGEDIEQVDHERAEDAKRERDLGLVGAAQTDTAGKPPPADNTQQQQQQQQQQQPAQAQHTHLVAGFIQAVTQFFAGATRWLSGRA